MADTRKDKRAPISLKVRFKSATLDEFIEQYSVDISRGGIFIKSKSPMAVGTLLKFEFQLKDESRLIHGVGRVVWKRDGSSDEPPGMGIKFIKMDPESRGLVEKMVTARGDAPGRFEDGQRAPSKPSSGGFFPDTTPQSELPAPEDRTQVRHASEFLASALAEGNASSAKKEAEERAEEARRRTEEIEREREEAAKKKKRRPRIKKTLVGMGIPSADDDPELGEAIARAKAGGAAPAISEQLFDDEPAEPSAPEPEPPSALDIDSELDDVLSSPPPAMDPEPDPPIPAPPPMRAEEPIEEPEDEPEPVPLRPAAAPAASAATRRSEAPRAEPRPDPSQSNRRPLREPEPEPTEDKSRTGLIVFAIIAAIAVAVIVWLQMNPNGLGGGGTDTSIDTDTTTDTTTDDGTTDDGTTDDGTTEDGTTEDGTTEDGTTEDVEPTPTVSVHVTTTPEGATVFVGEEEIGASPVDVDLPIGEAATVAATQDGYVRATQEVTAVEGDNDPVALTLERMPYVVIVTTEPDSARVAPPRGVTAEGNEFTLQRPPTAALSFAATANGYARGTQSVEPDAFSVDGDRMVARVTLTLVERRQPTGGGGGRGGGG
ncbi:MAG: TIGR02266 family protein, partial [Sandaracinaceae bacterium]